MDTSIFYGWTLKEIYAHIYRLSAFGQRMSFTAHKEGSTMAEVGNAIWCRWIARYHDLAGLVFATLRYSEERAKVEKQRRITDQFSMGYTTVYGSDADRATLKYTRFATTSFHDAIVKATSWRTVPISHDDAITKFPEFVRWVRRANQQLSPAFVAANNGNSTAPPFDIMDIELPSDLILHEVYYHGQDADVEATSALVVERGGLVDTSIKQRFFCLLHGVSLGLPCKHTAAVRHFTASPSFVEEEFNDFYR